MANELLLYNEKRWLAFTPTVLLERRNFVNTIELLSMFFGMLF